MKQLLKIVQELQSTSGKNDKEAIIRDNLNNKIFDEVLRFLFDDNITTGIKRTKLNKIAEKKTYVVEGIKAKSNIFELMDFVKSNNTGKEDVVNIALATADYLAEYQDFDITELVYSIICKDLKLGCSATTYNKANPENPVFNYDVMAGKAWDEERAKKLIKNGETLYFSIKEDGNRGSRNKYTLDSMISKNGKEWEGTREHFEELKMMVDSDRIPEGEFIYNDTTGLMTSQEKRSKTTSIMSDKSIKNKAEAGIVFRMFESPLREDFNDENSGETYEKRREIMDGYVDKIEELGLKYIQIIPIEFTVSTEEELKQVIPRLKEYIDSGEEGLMCIAGSQPYKTGKGYQMMKLKNILSGDMIISGWNYGKVGSSLEGKFASFDVDFPYVDKKGAKGIYTVTVGMGYSDEVLATVNKDPDSYVGKLVEFLCTEVSKNKKGGYSLSYARFVSFREDKNTIDLEKHTLVEIDGEFYFQED